MHTWSKRALTGVVAIGLATALGACNSTRHISEPQYTGTPPSTPPATSPVATNKQTTVASPYGRINVSNFISIPEPVSGMTNTYRILNTIKASVYVATWRLVDSTMEQALVSVHQRGLQVHVLLDSAQGGRAANQAAFNYLQQHQVPVKYLPSADVLRGTAILMNNTVMYLGTGSLDATHYNHVAYWLIYDNRQADQAYLGALQQAWQGKALVAWPNTTNLVPGDAILPTVGATVTAAMSNVEIETTNLGSQSLIEALVQAAHSHVKEQIVVAPGGISAAAIRQLTAAGAQVRIAAANRPLSNNMVIQDANTHHAVLIDGSQPYTSGASGVTFSAIERFSALTYEQARYFAVDFQAGQPATP